MSPFYVGLIVGAVLGGLIGTGIMCLVQINRPDWSCLVRECGDRKV